DDGARALEGFDAEDPLDGVQVEGLDGEAHTDTLAILRALDENRPRTLATGDLARIIAAPPRPRSNQKSKGARPSRIALPRLSAASGRRRSIRALRRRRPAGGRALADARTVAAAEGQDPGRPLDAVLDDPALERVPGDPEEDRRLDDGAGVVEGLDAEHALDGLEV